MFSKYGTWSTVLMVTLLGSVAGRAEADETIVRQGTPARPWYVSVSLGGALAARLPFETESSYHQFKLSEEAGYHLSGTAVGPAVGLTLQQAFGNSYKTVELAPKFSWDFLVLDKIGLHLSPSLAIGYAAWLPEHGDTSHGASIQITLEARIPFAERFYGFFRPVALDILAMSQSGETNTFLRYDLLLGAGIQI